MIFWPVVFMCLSLAGAVLLVFFPVIKHEFINFDDQFYVTDNPHVSSGLHWTNVIWAFGDAHLGNWHPVTWLSHMLDIQLFGMNAGGHHFTNLALHALNTVLLFLLLRGLTGAFWRSALVAVWFGLHPMHVESVAWVSERKDVLSTTFFLLALWAYTRYARSANVKNQKTWSWYWAALALFALGLMSKPMLVTAPLILLLLDLWPLKRVQNSEAETFPGKGLGSLLAEKVPFFTLAAADGLVTFWAQSQAGAVKELGELPLLERTANGLISYWRYIGKLFWPVDLSVFYPFPSGWPLWQVTVAALTLVASCWLVTDWRRRFPHLFLGWFWYLVTLTPVVGFLQTGIQSMADRYSYIRFIGMFITISWSAGRVAQRWRVREVLVGTSAILVLLLGIAARAQLQFWTSSESLFRHALAVTRDNALAYHCLGSALAARGDREAAVAEFQRAIQIRSDYHDAEVSLAITLGELGRAAESEARFQSALRRKPADLQARFQFAIALAMEGKFQEAAGQYQEVVRAKPDFAQAQNNFANTLQRLGRVEEAIAHYREALRVAPDLPEAHNNLGVALEATGQRAEAVAQYQEAIRLKPDYAEAYNNLGNVQASSGKLQEAVTNFSSAIRFQPQYPKAENSLGSVLAMQGRDGEAIQHFVIALRLRPDYLDAHFNLAEALARQGQELEASLHFQKVLKWQPENPMALSALARIYATSSEATVRRPSVALELAQRAVGLSGGTDPEALAALAASYAATGQTTNAIESAQSAVEMAMRSGRTNRLEALKRQLEEYQAKSAK